nr:hypothetical protein CICLE_v10006377mg [Ipomoea batatas]
MLLSYSVQSKLLNSKENCNRDEHSTQPASSGLGFFSYPGGGNGKQRDIAKNSTASKKSVVEKMVSPNYFLEAVPIPKLEFNANFQLDTSEVQSTLH